MPVGYRHSEESKNKMRAYHAGKVLSEEHKKNISKALKGRHLHKIDEETRKKISEKLKGRTIPYETRVKMSNALKGRKLSKEHIEKLVATMQTEEYKENHRKGCIRAQNDPSVRAKVDKARANRMKSKKPSDIEIKICNQLDENNIDYLFQHYIFSRKYGRGFTFDFYLPYENIIIEADGDYWHTLDSSVKNDIVKNEYCRFRHFNLVRIKGSEILKEDFDIMDYI